MAAEAFIQRAFRPDSQRIIEQAVEIIEDYAEQGFGDVVEHIPTQLGAYLDGPA